MHSNPSCKTSEKTRKAPQTRHHRNRTKAGHNRQRDHQSWDPMAASAPRIDTFARVQVTDVTIRESFLDSGNIQAWSEW
jgi:hypothetical protein